MSLLLSDLSAVDLKKIILPYYPNVIIISSDAYKYGGIDLKL